MHTRLANDNARSVLVYGIYTRTLDPRVSYLFQKGSTLPESGCTGIAKTLRKLSTVSPRAFRAAPMGSYEAYGMW